MGVDASLSWGRDIGPLSTRNSSKGALLRETQAVFRALNDSMSLKKVREECLRGNTLLQQASETRHRIWEAIHWRFFAWDPPAWVLTDLMEAARDEFMAPRFLGLVYIHFARRDRLTFDFVTTKIWDMWKNKIIVVRRDDLLDFLTNREEQHPEIKTWRESTRKKLAGNTLSALRDFGVLKGVQRKVIQQPAFAPEVALHLCRLLYAEGLRGRAALEAQDWRLFLWSAHHVADAFSRLAQVGAIRFERSGKTVILEIPGQEGRHSQ